MKKSKEIIGLPIISISDGTQIGAVKSLIINPGSATVDFITIEHEEQQDDLKAIPFKKIIGIGDYAVTIESEDNIINLEEIPIASNFVTNSVKIIGLKVLTRVGQLLGDATEYYVDEQSGRLLGIAIEEQGDKNELYISSEHIITFGKDLIIVSELAKKDWKPSRAVEEQAEIEVADKRIHTVKEKQIELLTGKKATKTIYKKNGEVLIADGTVLTEDLIKMAQDEGPIVMAELMINVE